MFISDSEDWDSKCKKVLGILNQFLLLFSFLRKHKYDLKKKSMPKFV